MTGKYNEVVGWRTMLRSIRHMPQWTELSDDGRFMLETMREQLRLEAKGEPRPGDRNIIARPFGKALVALLNRRGIKVVSPKPIDIAGRRKQADFAFEWRKKQWVIEIKTSLTFDSLASAALEGNAYFNKKSADRFLIISLYDNFNTVRSPEAAAMRTLAECGVEDKGLELFVVTRRVDYCPRDERYSLMTERLGRLLKTLPNG